MSLLKFTHSLSLITAALFASQSIAVAAPVWSTSTTLSTTKILNQNGLSISGQRVAINAKGQAIAAWNQGTEVKARINTSIKWRAAVSVSSTGEIANLIDLAESAQGDAVVLWSTNATSANMQSRFYQQGLWTAPTPIPASAGATIVNARVQYDGQTIPTATVVWVEKSALSCALMSATGSAATGWTAVQTISANSACYNFIDLAVNKNGEAAVALGATPPPVRHAGSPVVVTSRNQSGIWAGLTDLGSGVYGTAPKVAIANNGVAITSFSDANLGVQWSRRSPTDGSWSAKAVLDGGVPAVPTQIAMAANGDALVAYNSYYTVIPPAPLLATKLKNGSNLWSVPATITEATGSIESFDLAATPAGSFVVGWVDSVPTLPVGVLGASMGVSVLPAGTNLWSSNTLDGDMQGTYMIPSPTSVAAASGKAIAVWNNDYFNPVTFYSHSKLFASTTAIK